MAKAILIFMMGFHAHGGYAARYNPGVMKRVAHNRHMSVVACMMSSPTQKLGTWMYVYGENTDKLLHCRVTDVSAPQDQKRHIKRGIVAELDYNSSRIICGSVTNSIVECAVRVSTTEAPQ